MIFWGLYEKTELEFVRKHIDNNCDVIDLGSGVGRVACVAGKKLSIDNKMICVEANIGLIKTLRHNILKNIANKKIHVVNGVVGYGDKSAVGFSNEENFLVSKTVTSEKNQVKTITLKKLITQYGISDYILVSDIEGAEVNIMKKDGDSLLKCRKMIIEFHNTCCDGKRYNIEGVCKMIKNRTKMSLIDNYGSVFVFSRLAK